MKPYPHPAPAADDFATSRARLNEMITHLGSAGMMGCTQQMLEEYVTQAGRELQRQLMQDQLDARAAAEVRLEQVTGADEVIRRRAEAGHQRLVATTVGRVEVTRIAYRAAGAANLYPADAQLALPDRLYSFPLQRLVVHETAGGSLRAAREALIRGTGAHLGTRQLMQIATEAAADVRDFYRHNECCRPDPADAAAAGGRPVLVLSLDATGVNMIGSDLREPAPPRPPGPQPPSAQLSRRERSGRSRMAVVTAIYDALPAPRTAADILPADAQERAARRPGPKTSGRKVDASLEHSVAPMVASLFDQAESRDPQHLRRWVCLVDGANHQLECLEREAQRRGVQIDIVVDLSMYLSMCGRLPRTCTLPTQPERRSSRPPPATCWKATPHKWSPTCTPGYATTAITTLLPGCNALSPTCKPNSHTSTTTSPWPWAGRSPPV